MRKLTSLAFVVVSFSFPHWAVAQQYIDIAKGGSQICGVTSNNELHCSTGSAASRLEPPTSISELIQVEVGNAHACGLDTDGLAICWGDNNFGQLDAPATRVFESISAGWNHTCATTAELDSVCWGLADNGRTEVPTDGLPFVEIDAGMLNTCGLEAAGGIRCWGVEDYHWNPRNAVAQVQSFAASDTNSVPALCALLSDGSIECDIDSLNFTGNYTGVAALGFAMCALNVAGEIECQNTDSMQDAEIAELNSDTSFVELFSNQGLCALDVNSDIRCTSAIRTPGAFLAPLSNFISLPGVAITEPSAIDDLNASVYSDTTVELFWTSIRRAGDGRVVGAEIYRNGVLLTETNHYNSYLDTTLAPGVEYTYEVRIVNSRGDVGPSGNVITVNTADRTSSGGFSYVQPVRSATPDNLRALIYSDTVLELVWDRSAGNVFGYEVYRDHEYIGFTSGTSYLDDMLMSEQKHHYDVLAVNQTGDILGFAGVDLE